MQKYSLAPAGRVERCPIVNRQICARVGVSGDRPPFSLHAFSRRHETSASIHDVSPTVLMDSASCFHHSSVFPPRREHFILSCDFSLTRLLRFVTVHCPPVLFIPSSPISSLVAPVAFQSPNTLPPSPSNPTSFHFHPFLQAR